MSQGNQEEQKYHMYFSPQMAEDRMMDAARKGFRPNLEYFHFKGQEVTEVAPVGTSLRSAYEDCYLVGTGSLNDLKVNEYVPAELRKELGIPDEEVAYGWTDWIASRSTRIPALDQCEVFEYEPVFDEPDFCKREVKLKGGGIEAAATLSEEGVSDYQDMSAKRDEGLGVDGSPSREAKLG